MTPRFLVLTVVFLLAACGDGDHRAPQSTTPQTTLASKQGVGSVQVWIDGVVLEAANSRTVLQQGDVANVEINGVPIVFEIGADGVWQSAGRSLMVGERVCMVAFLDRNGGLTAGKTFAPAICGELRAEEWNSNEIEVR